MCKNACDNWEKKSHVTFNFKNHKKIIKLVMQLLMQNSGQIVYNKQKVKLIKCHFLIWFI